MSTSRIVIRSTGAQIRALVDYMTSNKVLANGKFKGPAGKRAYLLQWARLKSILKLYGPDKSIDQWRYTWRDIKKRAREDGMRLKQAQIDHMPLPKLSDQTKRILIAIGEHKMYGIDPDDVLNQEVIEDILDSKDIILSGVQGPQDIVVTSGPPPVQTRAMAGDVQQRKYIIRLQPNTMHQLSQDTPRQGKVVHIKEPSKINKIIVQSGNKFRIIPKKRSTTRCTNAQIKKLVDYMGRHLDFANGQQSDVMGSAKTVDQWSRLKRIMKAYGPDKSIQQWRHTWRDLKRRAREDNLRLERAKSENAPEDEMPVLSKHTQKILKILNNENDPVQLMDGEGTDEEEDDEDNETEDAPAASPVQKMEQLIDPLTIEEHLEDDDDYQQWQASVQSSPGQQQQEDLPHQPEDNFTQHLNYFRDNLTNKITEMNGVLGSLNTEIRKLAKQMHTKNQNAAIAARRRHLESVRSRRYCFKF